jgi:hypothetical protein
VVIQNLLLHPQYLHKEEVAVVAPIFLQQLVEMVDLEEEVVIQPLVDLELADKEMTEEMETFQIHNTAQMAVAVVKLKQEQAVIRGILVPVEMEKIFLQLLEHNLE